MCGIAGIYNPTGEPVCHKEALAMGELMAHRGPDDRGDWHEGQISLVHQRLSIVDLSSMGKNPMTNEDGQLQLVFNGEIYNHFSLRKKLLKKGHVFKSQTDTEVLLHLYEEMGADCVRELNGMFAFALWDRRRKRLILARDRFGVKPLYYTMIGNSIAFASEVKCFRALSHFRARVDVRGLSEHFTFQNTFKDRTLFQGVKLLEPGYFLSCRTQGVAKTRYWDLAFEPEYGRSFEDCAQDVQELFAASVKRQLQCDVSVGAYLSGGIDSGSILSEAVRTHPQLKTYTCGFKLPQDPNQREKFFDERKDSREMAGFYNSDHHELTLDHNAMPNTLAQVMWHLDEPRVGISYQVLHTARMIRKTGTKVVLSGVGGDELFAGYPWRYLDILNTDSNSFLHGYFDRNMRFLTDSQKKNLFSLEVNDELEGFRAFDSYADVLKGHSDDDPLHKAMYFDFKTFLNGLLTVDDKLSMAASLEVRVPFLDNDLVDYVRRIPSEYLLDGETGKAVLRKAMAKQLPENTIRRRKQGFTPPDCSWYKGENLSYVKDLILSDRSLQRGYFNPDYLRKVINNHLSNQYDNRFFIWSLMGFEWWNRLFIDGDPLPEASF